MAGALTARSRCHCCDTAHGHSTGVLRKIAENSLHFYEDRTLICQAILQLLRCTRLFDAGVDVVKVGIGPGSICTTRVIASVRCAASTAASTMQLQLRVSMEKPPSLLMVELNILEVSFSCRWKCSHAWFHVLWNRRSAR